MTKILNFALKIKGVVGRVAHAKSSDPATPPKFGTCTFRQIIINRLGVIDQVLYLVQELRLKNDTLNNGTSRQILYERGPRGVPVVAIDRIVDFFF